MKLKILACNIFWREISLLGAKCPNILDITYLRQEYHDYPNEMRQILNEEISKIEQNIDEHSCNTDKADFDAIVIAYGLCGNGVLGIHSDKYPLIIPRAHDCITLFMGSKEAYRDYFDANKGTFFYNSGYLETNIPPSNKLLEAKRSAYLQKYDEEDVDFLMEMEMGYIKNYQQATYIEFPGLENEALETITQQCAHELNWKYDKYRGDDSLMRDMLWGNWPEDKFLIVPPGQVPEFTADKDIFTLGIRK